ncbi:MAG TPA: Trk system potassium transporter TrkA [Clostridiaceae bacterium]|nr:Trk system potassium transporter TrkA [Clostridiaceae bacterium]
MEIVVCGAGKIGETLCRVLAQEDHNIVLIDKDRIRLEKLINNIDMTGVCGDAVLYDTQMEANVPDCDIFIAVTPSDDSNLIASVTAKALGAKRIITRVRNPQYMHQTKFFADSFKIDYIINPELETARDLARMIQMPEAISVEHFNHGRFNIVNLVVPEKSVIDGMNLIDFRRNFPNVLICIIKRDDENIIPIGSDKIHAEDNIFVTGQINDIRHLIQKLYGTRRLIHSVMIVGAGRITNHLIPRLERFGLDITVIDVKKDICRQMATDHPNIVMIHGDGTDQRLLAEERAEAYDALICLTGIDEENLVLAIYGSQMKIGKTIAKVNRINLLKVLDLEDRLSVVTPHQIIANKIIRYVRSVADLDHANIEGLYRLADGKVEMIQFLVSDKCQAAGHTLLELPTKPNVLISVIVRNDQLILPTGQDKILTGDRVLAITTQSDVSHLDDLFKFD